MRRNKWNYKNYDPHTPTFKRKDRYGMLIILLIGFVLLVGGFLLVWKIGAFNINTFFGSSTRITRSNQTEVYILLALHLPWVIGLLMVLGGAKYFWMYLTRK